MFEADIWIELPEAVKVKKLPKLQSKDAVPEVIDNATTSPLKELDTMPEDTIPENEPENEPVAITGYDPVWFKESIILVISEGWIVLPFTIFVLGMYCTGIIINIINQS